MSQRGTHSQYTPLQLNRWDDEEEEPKLNGYAAVPGVINIAAVKKYILVATASKYTDEMALYVTDDVGGRVCREVDELLDALKDGLRELIAAFGQYSSDLRLTRADMRMAREAAEKKNKVQEEEAVAEVPGRAAAAVARPAEAQPQMQQVR